MPSCLVSGTQRPSIAAVAITWWRTQWCSLQPAMQLCDALCSAPSTSQLGPSTWVWTTGMEGCLGAKGQASWQPASVPSVPRRVSLEDKQQMP